MTAPGGTLLKKSAVAAALLACAFAAAAAEPEIALSPNKSLFWEISGLVEQHFYSRELVAKKFPALRREYRKKAEAAASREEFAAAVNGMLEGLGASHTRYYTREDPAYYQLASIFSFQPEVRKLFKGQPVAYPSIGLLTERDGDKVFVTGVLDGSVAQKAGILRGDEIVSADGRPYRPVRSLRETAAGSLVLEVRRSAGEEPFRVEVAPATVEPSEEFLAAEKNSVRLIPAGDRKIGYIHIWSYAGERYQQELVDEITGGVLKDADALVWDLRDGWGGADPAYLNLFNRKVPVLTLRDREGKFTAADPQWRKPAVMLVNRRSRSGKEVLAYGFRKYGLGAVVGEKTAGQVLAGRLFVLSDGSLLYLAVGEARADGELLEGAGVEPDVAVPLEYRYSAGRDPQLEKAVELMGR